MKQENEDYLKQTYPLMFPKEFWGIECSNGWFNIISVLCQNIQSHITWKKGECPQVVVTQVKEKFGTLRFYYDGGDEYISGLVSMAEAMSEVTCETCGTPGHSRHGGWIKVLCDTHYQEREQAKNDTP
jgi:hypothetical protein